VIEQAAHVFGTFRECDASRSWMPRVPAIRERSQRGGPRDSPAPSGTGRSADEDARTWRCGAHRHPGAAYTSPLSGADRCRATDPRAG
jgi:hypothetical protein